MNKQIPSEGDFFFTSQDLYLMAKGLNHFIECDCANPQELVDCFPLLEKIEMLNRMGMEFEGLGDIAQSWDTPGVEE